jgi:HD-GYP domain-containing protein (c-di-GMP phosphodiesterase class II)
VTVVLNLPIEFARPGLTLAAPLRDPSRNGALLLNHGCVLEDEAAIARLREAGVTSLYVEHGPLGHLDRFLAPLRGKARPLVEDQISRTFAALTGEAACTVGYADYYAAGHEVICCAMQKGLEGVYLDELTPRRADDHAGHAAAVAQLSVILGVKLEDYLVSQRRRLNPTHAKEVVNLAVAGMLHDIGKARLPAELRGYTDAAPPSDPRERAEWASHARLSYEIVGRGVEASAATAILHHHQRFDGSGNPNSDPAPLAGDKIHIFARIITAADLFDRLSSTPCGTRRRPNVEVLYILRTTYAGWLDPLILHTLPRVCFPFPPGSRVTLADGSDAVVASINRRDPYHPVVWRVGDDGMTFIGEPLRTASRLPGHQIQMVDGIDVTAMFPEELEPVSARRVMDEPVAA